MEPVTRLSYRNRDSQPMVVLRASHGAQPADGKHSPPVSQERAISLLPLGDQGEGEHAPLAGVAHGGPLFCACENDSFCHKGCGPADPSNTRSGHFRARTHESRRSTSTA